MVARWLDLDFVFDDESDRVDDGGGSGSGNGNGNGGQQQRAEFGRDYLDEFRDLGW